MIYQKLSRYNPSGISINKPITDDRDITFYNRALSNIKEYYRCKSFIKRYHFDIYECPNMNTCSDILYDALRSIFMQCKNREFDLYVDAFKMGDEDKEAKNFILKSLSFKYRIKSKALP